MRPLSLTLVALLLSLAAATQQPAPPPAPGLVSRPANPVVPAEQAIVVPAGTKVLLSLLHPLYTKTARVGDGVYLQSSFPVTINDQMVIPAGTYVQGTITELKRPGRIKGRAELRFRFTTLIFPSGYTVYIPAAVENVPGIEHAQVKDKEGTIQEEGQKGKDAGTIAGTAAAGSVIGLEAGAARGGSIGKSAAIGGLIGAAVGTGIVLLTRGNDVRLEPGTAVEMVFDRAIALDRAKLRRTAAP